MKVSAVCPGDMKTRIYQNMVVMNMPREQALALFDASDECSGRGTRDPAGRGSQSGADRLSCHCSIDLAPVSLVSLPNVSDLHSSHEHDPQHSG